MLVHTCRRYIFFSIGFSMKCLAQKARDAMRRRHKCFMTSSLRLSTSSRLGLPKFPVFLISAKKIRIYFLNLRLLSSLCWGYLTGIVNKLSTQLQFITVIQIGQVLKLKHIYQRIYFNLNMFCLQDAGKYWQCHLWRWHSSSSKTVWRNLWRLD